MVQYWLDLFTPGTWEEFLKSGRNFTGFRGRMWSMESKIKPSDMFICYVTNFSRFSGILKAVSSVYKDENKAKSVWKSGSFPCLIDIEPIIILDLLHSIPKNEILPKISIGSKWGGIVRGSPKRIPFEDGEIIKKILEESKKQGLEYPLKEITKSSLKIDQRRKKQEYGSPIDFRGLRHAPINEQGVVYIFALLSRDLGFTVEALGTSFPDCEAKRKIDKKGERWERCHIEFEYKSSEFKKHGHPTEGCDMIVCWEHDWKECPLEVIELSSVLKKLGARFE